MSYDLKPVKAPRLAGGMLRFFTGLIERGFTGRLLAGKLLKDAGISAFRKVEFSETPCNFPLMDPSDNAAAYTVVSDEKLTQLLANPDPRGFRFPSVLDFRKAYESKQTTPLAVAERVIEAVVTSNSGELPLCAIIQQQASDLRHQAEMSTQRWQAGQPLGVLDGIPVAIKDEVDVETYPTTVGTRFLGKHPATSDGTPVAALRRQGALIIGKANMHEIGIGVTGYNAHHGICRNPYNPEHYPGGSSSGSGSSLAAGICSVALGADGGGSIRIPSGLCGVYGLKATFGRISEHGAAPLCWSVAHVGPMTNRATDLALAYAIMAGQDQKDPNTGKQPAIELPDFNQTIDLKNKRIGVYRDWFQDADPEIVAANEAMLAAFVNEGAELIDIDVPQLENMRVAHVLSIASEMCASFETRYEAHKRDFGYDIRINLALARFFTARDYIRAQQMRTRALHIMDQVFDRVDVVATPTTGISAPRIKRDVVRSGESDLVTLSKIMRFQTLANLTGHPAVSFPVGYDRSGLPIGMQLMAPHWEEKRLLEFASVSEAHLERRKPMVYFDLLGGIQ